MGEKKGKKKGVGDGLKIKSEKSVIETNLMRRDERFFPQDLSHLNIPRADVIVGNRE